MAETTTSETGFAPINGARLRYEVAGDGHPPIIQEMIAADEPGDLDRMNDLAVQLWVNGLYRTPDQVDLAIRERVREMNKIALQNAAESTDEQALGPPAAGRLSEIKAPTLVIVGEVDVLTTHHAAKLMVEQMANAQQAVIPNTAHLPNMERPDEFNRVVLDFLRAL